MTGKTYTQPLFCLNCGRRWPATLPHSAVASKVHKTCPHCAVRGLVGSMFATIRKLEPPE